MQGPVKSVVEVVVDPGVVVVLAAEVVVVVLVVGTSEASTAVNWRLPPDFFQLTEPVALRQAGSISACRTTRFSAPHVPHLARTLVPRLVPFTWPRFAGQPLARLTLRPVIVRQVGITVAGQEPRTDDVAGVGAGNALGGHGGRREDGEAGSGDGEQERVRARHGLILLLREQSERREARRRQST